MSAGNALMDIGRPPCVAVVEDDSLVRQAWCEAVAASGYEVLEAADGTELLAHLREARPKLILLDMLLPNADGFEILARLRADAEWTDIPILVVSELAESLAEAVDEESAQRLRIAGFLPKSVPLDTLLDHLTRLVGEPPDLAEPPPGPARGLPSTMPGTTLTG